MFVMLLISFHISLKIVIWLTRLLQFIRMLSGCLSCLISVWIWIAHLSPIYMLGLHAVKLPPSHGFMPSWDLSDLLLFLQSLKFYPLETWSFLRLSQKTLALILLASGRRIHEISSLSREFRRSGDKVVLYWPEGSKAKCYRVGHYPEDPSIRKRSHFCRT